MCTASGSRFEYTKEFLNDKTTESRGRRLCPGVSEACELPRDSADEIRRLALSQATPSLGSSGMPAEGSKGLCFPDPAIIDTIITQSSVHHFYLYFAWESVAVSVCLTVWLLV